MFSRTFVLFVLLALVIPSLAMKKDKKPEAEKIKVAREKYEANAKVARDRAFKKNGLLKGKSKSAKKVQAAFDHTIEFLARTVPTCSPATCLLIDGSVYPSNSQFTKMKQFATLLTSTLTFPSAEYASYQYIQSTNFGQKIQGRTSNEALFESKTLAATSAQRPFVFVKGGLQDCIDELAASGADTKNVVLLGDVDTYHGAEPQAITLANQWLAQSTNHRFIAGIIGHSGNDNVENYFIDLTGGFRSDVRRYANWHLLAEKVECFAAFTCGVTSMGVNCDDQGQPIGN